MTRAPGLDKRSREDLEAMFGQMWAGWDRGVNMEGPDTGFRETPMTPLELEARYVAAEVGANIFEISNLAAFAPIIVYQLIQKFLGPVVAASETELVRLQALLNTPETEDWFAGARLEAVHQIERWGTQHDVGKTPWDWFWLIGYLAQKAAAAAAEGDVAKAKHHTISTAAALLNWHRHLSGESTSMRPGIDPGSA